jgi:hypothetical protein
VCYTRGKQVLEVCFLCCKDMHMQGKFWISWPYHMGYRLKATALIVLLASHLMVQVHPEPLPQKQNAWNRVLLSPCQMCAPPQ